MGIYGFAAFISIESHKPAGILNGAQHSPVHKSLNIRIRPIITYENGQKGEENEKRREMEGVSDYDAEPWCTECHREKEQKPKGEGARRCWSWYRTPSSSLPESRGRKWNLLRREGKADYCRTAEEEGEIPGEWEKGLLLPVATTPTERWCVRIRARGSVSHVHIFTFVVLGYTDVRYTKTSYNPESTGIERETILLTVWACDLGMHNHRPNQFIKTGKFSKISLKWKVLSNFYSI